ncbi:piercer of microtubule wall 1 protein [Tenrec ecaudatus]|uniref:piercer of microtubule wall 1 protein n=1 Tax=Tenrec ecaudatus TaxID=94439 RepID=UPI003F592C8A
MLAVRRLGSDRSSPCAQQKETPQGPLHPHRGPRAPGSTACRENPAAGPARVSAGRGSVTGRAGFWIPAGPGAPAGWRGALKSRPLPFRWPSRRLATGRHADLRGRLCNPASFWSFLPPLVRSNMSQEDPQAMAGPPEQKAEAPPEKTCDCYHVSADLPARFNNPGWFRGYRSQQPVSVYRTSNQAYGGRAPTVHEMPKVYYPTSGKFSQHLATFGMSRSSTLNVSMDKSFVTGPDNNITPFDRLDFHPSYNPNQPSICS